MAPRKAKQTTLSLASGDVNIGRQYVASIDELSNSTCEIKYMSKGVPLTTGLSVGITVQIQGDIGCRSYLVAPSKHAGDRHFWLQCLTSETRYNQHDSPDNTHELHLQCNYRQRADRISFITDKKTGISLGTHKCHLVPVETIESYGTLLNKGGWLARELALVAGRLNLSLEAVISPTVHNLLCNIFSLGQKNATRSWESVVRWPSRHMIRGALIAVSAEERQRILAIFRESPFISCAIDEGSTLGTKYLNLIIHDVASDRGEYSVSTQIVEGTGTALQYAASLHSGFLDLFRYRLNVGTVVVDGGTAQMKALGPKKDMVRDRLLKQKIPDEIVRFITFPCACHIINNCYKKLVEDSQAFRNFIEGIREVSNAIHRAPDCNLHCPQFVSTRWVYDASIIRYLVQHKDEVDAFIRTVGLEIDWKLLEDYKPIVYMTRSLVNQFESANAPMADVWPRVYTLASDLRRKAKKHVRPVITAYLRLAKLLENRVLLNGKYIIAFLLTPVGRDWFRYPEPWRVKPLINDYSYTDSGSDSTDTSSVGRAPLDFALDGAVLRMEQRSIATQTEQSGAIDVTSTEQSQRRSRLQHRHVLSDDESTGYVTYSETSSDEHTDLQETQSDDCTESDSLDGVRPDLGYGAWLPLAKREWMEMVKIVFGGDKTKETAALAQFETYVASGTTIFDQNLVQLLKTNRWNWDTLRGDPVFAEIGEMAVRIRPTPASEASAERYISLQRLVVIARRNRAKEDLNEARMSLLRRPADARESVYVHVDVDQTRDRIKRGSETIRRARK